MHAGPDREAVGRRFDVALLERARERSWAVLGAIRERMVPGIDEAGARAMAEQVFAEAGVARIWHPTLIRIGANTVKTWRQRSDPTLRLGENDSYFIDLGLVFDGHEGDVGDTFTVGHAPERQAAADAARRLFAEVATAWREQGLAGPELYRFAGERAAAMGWRLNHAVKGHRIGDYPHAVHRGGTLGDFAGQPAARRWTLEIQIAHPDAPYGAFYEDLLDAGPET
ncbi:MAG TPA: M24 family metallopeptidase [Dyella sp.]|nr:M24 family metallopeptidase [Dyella sp.]